MLSSVDPEVSSVFTYTALKIIGDANPYHCKEIFEILSKTNRAFYPLAITLTQNVSDWNREGFIKGLPFVAPEHSSCLSNLIEGANNDDKIEIIKAFQSVNPTDSDAFAEAATTFYQEAGNYNGLKELSTLDSRHYESALRLTDGVESNYRGEIIEILRSVNPKHSEAFARSALIITKEMKDGKRRTMRSLSALNPMQYRTAIKLTEGMSDWNKETVMKALTMFKSKYIEIFLRRALWLTAGMETFNRVEVLMSFSLIPMERLAAIHTEFSPERFPNLLKYVGSGGRCTLFQQLGKIETSSDRIAKIDSEIESYKVTYTESYLTSSKIEGIIQSAKDELRKIFS